MMFTLEYRLTLANRSSAALRDIAVRGKLVCAQLENAPVGAEVPPQELALIERIGPNQIHTITGALSMKVTDIRLLKSAKTPMFIPLLAARVEAPGASPSVTRFVIGKPSPLNAARLQPIALDTSIGGIEGLRADRIQPFKESETVSQ